MALGFRGLGFKGLGLLGFRACWVWGYRVSGLGLVGFMQDVIGRPMREERRGSLTKQLTT